MTDETNVETISSESSGNSIADNNSDFYSKLAALTGGERQDETIEEEHHEESSSDEIDGRLEEVAEQTVDDEEEDVPGAENIPKGLQKRWKKVIDLKNKVKSELEQEKEQRIRYQTQYENYEKALQKYFEGQGNPEDIASSQGLDSQSDFDPLDETAHNMYMKEINDLRKELQEVKGKTVTKEEIQTQQATQAFTTTIDSQRREFEVKTPDYKDALNYLHRVKISEAEMIYGSGEAASTAALQDILTKSAGLYQQGKNVPESIYNMAKSYGYTGKAKTNGSNIDAINNNMKRGAGEPANRASVPMGTSNFTQPGYLKKLRDADGAIDGNKFQSIIDSIRNGG